MRAQKEQTGQMRVCEKTLAAHTCAKELYRRKDKKKTEQIVHCLCQCAAGKGRKEKKNRQQCFAD